MKEDVLDLILGIIYASISLPCLFKTGDIIRNYEITQIRWPIFQLIFYVYWMYGIFKITVSGYGLYYRIKNKKK